MRVALVALVAVLMVLNSIGVYGFLSRAHIEHALAGDVTVSRLVRYLATLLGSTDEQTMRYFILIVAQLLDPAAVLLLLAATHRGRQ